jgi:hypothetical protein
MAEIKASKHNEDNEKVIEIHDYDRPPSTVQEFLKLRQEIDISEGSDEIIEDNDPFMFLVEHLFGQAHGLRNWKNAKCYRKVSEILTVSDEAYILLSIENSWDAIKEEIDNNDEPEAGGKRGTYAHGKYTNQGTNLRYGGWTKEGIKRFNELYELVEKNRKEPWAQKVEEQVSNKLWNRHHNKAGDKSMRRKKRRIIGPYRGEQEEGHEDVQV